MSDNNKEPIQLPVSVWRRDDGSGRPIWAYSRRKAKAGGNGGKPKPVRTPNRRPHEPRGKVIWDPNQK